MASASPTCRSTKPASGPTRPGHVVWIGLFEPDEDLLARVQAQFNLHPLAIEDAGNGASAAQDRAIWRIALHRGAHRADAGKPHRLRRDAYFRRQGLCRLGSARRVGVLRQGARALRILPDLALAWRGLHPLCDPRFYRRQLRAGSGGDQRRGRGDRGYDPQQDARSREYRPALSPSARPPAPAQCGLAAARCVPAACAYRSVCDRRGDGSRISATSPITSAA